jgi:hypothetical protein
MLAMTGSDYGAIVISVLMLVGLYFAVRFTVRVVKAPFRMLRRSPAPTELGRSTSSSFGRSRSRLGLSSCRHQG